MTKVKSLIVSLLILGLLFLAASILLPTYTRNRRELGLERTSRNLHQIGLAILIYNGDHNGQFPDSLATLVANTNLSTESLIDPLTDDSPAKQATTQEIRNELAQPGHQSYVYLGTGLTDKTATVYTLVAYEIFPDASSNVLLGDGHTEWLTPSQTKAMLNSISSRRPTTVPVIN